MRGQYLLQWPQKVPQGIAHMKLLFDELEDMFEYIRKNNLVEANFLLIKQFSRVEIPEG